MAYNGRRGPNVSAYIASLNKIPSAQEVRAQEEFSLEDDLAMFTNTQFFDFDALQNADLQPGGYGVDGNAQGTVSPENIDIKAMEFSSSKLYFLFGRLFLFLLLPLPYIPSGYITCHS